MANVYTTRQGETVDLACWRYYGRTVDVTEAVLSANPGLSEMDLVLPMGTRILMPDIAAKPLARELVQLWT